MSESTESTASGTVTLGIYENHRQVANFELGRTTEIGRRQVNEPAPYEKITLAECDRVIVAELAETAVSRKHLTFELLPTGTVTVTNDSSKNSVPILGNIRLAPGEKLTLELPIACEIGNRVVRVYMTPREELQFLTLNAATHAPGRSGSRPSLSRGMVTSHFDEEEELFLFDWLQASMDVFQSAATSVDFLSKAARAAVELVGLNSATVLLYNKGQWNVAARDVREGEPIRENWTASQTMLKRVLEQRRTFFNVPVHDANIAASLVDVQSLVAAPFLDRNGEVLGVLYGERRSGLNSLTQIAIRELDAKLVELLAYGVASGIARIEQERLLVAERVRFEQFFTPELARMLSINGDEMLSARDAEITVLFCDIKGFSRISAACGASLSIEWVCDVLSELSDCVAAFQGVLVDYAGDALEALWGAPLPTSDHAAMACRAALQMRQTLPAINQRWQARLGELTDISIGIHTGSAKVGNIGSRRKFKYGALGTTVNLTSRIQGATKFVGGSVLASGSTMTRSNRSFDARRICTIRTINIAESVDVYELCEVPCPEWDSLKLNYEQALADFERQEFMAAKETLMGIIRHHPDDIPTQRLLERLSIAAAAGRATSFDPVWNLSGK
ncbi:MAG: GAF domain-containing protein [Pirellula sp.]|nr:GAF domain-containing protein [Pirellula sp.]